MELRASMFSRFARVAVALVMLAGLLVVASRAEAGGWASVRLAKTATDPVVGQPWQAELVVKQHDTREVDVDQLYVRFIHQESGSQVTTDGVPTGELGHYLIDVVFDQTGIWDWVATPAPFGPMNMTSLQVLETAAATDIGAPSVTIVQGTCVSPGQQLGGAELEQPESLSGSVATGILPNFGEIVSKAQNDAISVIILDGTAAKQRLACGELPASGLTTPVALVLEPDPGSNTVGTISLIPGENGVTASVTVISQLAGQGVVIRITDADNGLFAPSSITIPAGTNVTWRNDSVVGHTVTGGNGAGFKSSGMLDPGASFSQTFDDPGTFLYVCDPHQWMTGTITVVE